MMKWTRRNAKSTALNSVIPPESVWNCFVFMVKCHFAFMQIIAGLFCGVYWVLTHDSHDKKNTQLRSLVYTRTNVWHTRAFVKTQPLFSKLTCLVRRQCIYSQFKQTIENALTQEPFPQFTFGLLQCITGSACIAHKYYFTRHAIVSSMSPNEKCQISQCFVSRSSRCATNKIDAYFSSLRVNFHHFAYHQFSLGHGCVQYFLHFAVDSAANLFDFFVFLRCWVSACLVGTCEFLYAIYHYEHSLRYGIRAKPFRVRNNDSWNGKTLHNTNNCKVCSSNTMCEYLHAFECA